MTFNNWKSNSALLRSFALAIIFLLTFFSSRPASAQTVSVACSPCFGPAGTVVQVTLSGWGDGLPVQVVAASDPGGGGSESGPSGCGATNANCTAPVTMPSSSLQTTYYFVAQQDGFIVTASTTFTVIPPSFTMSPTCGPGGTSVTITGQLFPTSSAIDIYFGAAYTLVGSAMTDANGSFTQPVTIPGSQSGLVSAEAASGGAIISQEFTAPSCTKIGTVTEVTGLSTSGGQTLAVGSPIDLDGTLVTAPNAQVQITFNDNTQLTLGQNSSLVLDQYVYNPSSTPNGNFFWRLAAGALQYVSGFINANPNPPDNKVIEMPYGDGGIRGTQFIAWPGTVPNSTEIDLLTGILALTPQQAGSTVFTGPLTIVMSATGTTTSPLTAAQYNTIMNNLFTPSSTDTTPPVVTVTFPAPPATQAGYFNASQVPVQGTVSANDHSNVTAISCTDTLSGLTEGALIGGGTATASRTLSVLGNGAHAITCTATDGSGNTGAASGSVNAASINIDATPPSINGSASPVSNSNGWDNTNVTVSFTCSDALSGLASCSAATILTAEGKSESVTGTAIDQAGNSAQATVNGINIDKTAPTVTYTGNAGTYTTSQTIAITCTASDALSGVASTTCANINGPASSFGVGVHNYSATATDNAGNIGSGSTSFTVTASVAVTFQSLIQLVDSWEKVPLQKAEMDATLLAADVAFAVKDNKLGDSLLNDFIKEVSAQSGKSLTAAQASQLIQDAQLLIK